MPAHSEYIYRCITLAEAGRGYVKSNPLVGAVLVHNGKIIGEGWHKRYGEAHAEVNCIQAAIDAGFENKLQDCDLYVSLEPCCHFGKTSPCTDLIIRNKIPRVHVGCIDPNPRVHGKGIEQLRNTGVEVTVATGELSEKCRSQNIAFFTAHEKARPYIVLKWAQTADGFTGTGTTDRMLISSSATRRLVHKWRSELMGIMVGPNTVMLDNPSLTVRDWPGPSPLRVVVDRNLRIPQSMAVFDSKAPTLVLNNVKTEMHDNLKSGVSWFKMEKSKATASDLAQYCFQHGIQSLLVEGGTKLLQSFIDEMIWDEARVITNKAMFAGDGVRAPILKNNMLVSEEKHATDTIAIYRPA
jgi:diaminohydroxyphosphoribosylaminopyrimidine deaminase/5-amino-6-(5-phosphoribosylamino)uracil reductase